MMKIWMDEAGRGPLAGPMMVGVVVGENAQDFLGFGDSKKIAEKMREKMWAEIVGKFRRGVGIAQPGLIDAVGVTAAWRRAAIQAMVTALGVGSQETLETFLQKNAVELVVDGPRDFGLTKSLGVVVSCEVVGDARIPAVGAASIVAKVVRDRWMKKLDQKFPEFGWAKNKGYGTLAHRQAIWEWGLTPLHRRSFCKKFLGK